MNKFLTCTVLLLLANYLSAQRITPVVLANAGDVMKSGNFSIEWTLGELAVETLKNGNSTLTQGFHQGQITITKTNDVEIIGLKIYPNPTVDNLIIENLNSEGRVELISNTGISIQKDKLQKGLSTYQLQHLPSGAYFLNINIDNIKHCYKIIKN